MIFFNLLFSLGVTSYIRYNMAINWGWVLLEGSLEHHEFNKQSIIKCIRLEGEENERKGNRQVEISFFCQGLCGACQFLEYSVYSINIFWIECIKSPISGTTQFLKWLYSYFEIWSETGESRG